MKVSQIFLSAKLGARLVHLVGVGQHELGLVVAQVFEGSDAELVEGRAKLLKKKCKWRS